MPGIIAFRSVDVKPLLDELTHADAYSPTTEDLFNPEMYPDGVPRDKEGRSESEVEFFWPDASRVIQSSVEPSLILVGDGGGIYLITNAKVPGTPNERGTVAYAIGCNPQVDEDSYDNKRTIFGGDDGAVKLPPRWFQYFVDAGRAEVKIRLKDDSVELVSR